MTRTPWPARATPCSVAPAAPEVATRTDLQRAPGDKVFGLFNKGNLTIEKFKQGRHPDAPQAAEPTLAEMTARRSTCSKGKRRESKGFFLQVEGALIDKRSHANDAAQTLGRSRRSTTRSRSP